MKMNKAEIHKKLQSKAEIEDIIEAIELYEDMQGKGINNYDKFKGYVIGKGYSEYESEEITKTIYQLILKIKELQNGNLTN